MKKQKGFTLLEILLVVAALGILAGIVILAINPSKQLGDTRNVERRADVNTILNAVYQYAVDTGKMPTAITTTETEICAQPPCADLIDLSVLTENQEYLVAVPTDPTGSSGSGAGYTIIKSANERITVSAPDAENGQAISVTR